MEMPTILLAGTPFERGVAHGSTFRDEIDNILRRDLHRLSERELAEGRRRASHSLEEIRKASSQVAAELEGIAAGSCQPVSDIVLRSGFELLRPISDGGCSAVALRTEHGAIVAQNWDSLPFKRSEVAVFVHFSDRGFELAMVAPIGSLGVVGMNRHGLALVNNDLLLKATRDGIPSYAIRRLVLESSTVDEAKAKLAALRHMGGRNYFLADRTGAIVGAEVSASTGAHFASEGDVLLHTNHAVLAETAGQEDQDELADVYPSSISRLTALQASMAREARSVDGIKRMLQDELGAPDSVCKTASSKEPTETVFSVVMDCARGEIHLATGRPSVNVYRKFVCPIS